MPLWMKKAHGKQLFNSFILAGKPHSLHSPFLLCSFWLWLWLLLLLLLWRWRRCWIPCSGIRKQSLLGLWKEKFSAFLSSPLRSLSSAAAGSSAANRSFCYRTMDPSPSPLPSPMALSPSTLLSSPLEPSIGIFHLPLLCLSVSLCSALE